MKTAILTLAVLFGFSALAGNGEGEEKTLKVNTEKSTIFWTGKKVTGEHTGTLKIKDGMVKLEDNVPVMVKLDIDMESIVCTDIKDEGTNQKLVGHLKSDDFFSVAKHPVGQFTATEFTPLKSKGDREPNYLVKGELILKGISKPVEFKALISVKDNGVVSNGAAVFDRAEYDIQFRSGSFFENLGDKMIYDDVELNFVFAAE